MHVYIFIFMFFILIHILFIYLFEYIGIIQNLSIYRFDVGKMLFNIFKEYNLNK